MDGLQVNELEKRIAAAIVEALRSHGEGIDVGASIAHLMAKAAVAVLEAAQDRRPPED